MSSQRELKVKWIPRSKAKIFQRMFEEIKESLGTYDDARAYVGFSEKVTRNLKCGNVTAKQARKIMDAWRIVCGGGANG